MLDLKKQLTYVQRSDLDAATKDDVTKRVAGLCGNINFYVGHMARMVNQERFWPDLLLRMKEQQMYDHVAVKSVGNHTHNTRTLTHTHTMCAGLLEKVRGDSHERGKVCDAAEAERGDALSLVSDTAT